MSSPPPRDDDKNKGVGPAADLTMPDEPTEKSHRQNPNDRLNVLLGDADLHPLPKPLTNTQEQGMLMGPGHPIFQSRKPTNEGGEEGEGERSGRVPGARWDPVHGPFPQADPDPDELEVPGGGQWTIGLDGRPVKLSVKAKKYQKGGDEVFIPSFFKKGPHPPGDPFGGGGQAPFFR